MVQTNSEHVATRINDWVSRLNQLYDTLDEWLASISHDKVVRGTLRQPTEPLMRQFGIAPRDVPTYTIFRSGHRVEFAPSALWVAGANGRINITTGKKQHVLVDRGDSGHGSKWQLIVDDYRRLAVPFNKSQLQRLLSESQ